MRQGRCTHLPRVDTEDSHTGLGTRWGELDLAVDAPGPDECRVERLDFVGGHDDLDVAARVEAVELVDELQHRALYFIVSTSAVIETSSTNSVDFIEEDDARFLAPRHLEELADHARTFSDVLLHEFGTDDTDERGVCPVRYCAGAQSLASTWWTKQKNTLRWVDTELDKTLWLKVRVRLDVAHLRAEEPRNIPKAMESRRLHGASLSVPCNLLRRSKSRLASPLLASW